MSANGVYLRHSPRSQPPYAGPEHRSNTALKRLSRELNQGCLQASGPLELAAWLETLGYQAPSVQTSLGVADTFELAETLYTLTQTARARKSEDNHLRPV